MNSLKLAFSLLFSCLALLVAAPGLAEEEEPLRPLPIDLKFDVNKLALGKKLFSDKRLSKDNSLSCASCHDLAHGGADSKPFSVGLGGAALELNTPSIFNSGLNFRQQWSGGSATPEELIYNGVPLVFNLSWNTIVDKLSQDGQLKNGFKIAYQEGVTPENITDAIATFQRSLITPSRFDRYLRGDTNAITADEKRGYADFKAYGCVSCHQGVNIGGNMFQRFGAMNDYFKAKVAAGNAITPADRGRYNITKKLEDMYVFKVPSLRNVALTAPYFHDASASSLEDAVDVMFRYQLGRTAPADDKAHIVMFLKSLTGEYKE